MKQLTSRPDHQWPELWKSMGEHAKLKEKQKWSEEKIHLENARKLRGIYFIDPKDTEFKETIKNARKKLETSVAPAMPCKFRKFVGVVHPTKFRRNLRVFWKRMNPPECVWGISEPPHHEEHIAGKGENSLQHYNLVHKFIPLPQAMKKSGSKSSGGQGMGKIGENLGVELDKVKSKKDVVDEARTAVATVHLHH